MSDASQSTSFFSMKPHIEHYNLQWPSMFEAEKILLEKVFINQIKEVFHFGSTSVPGMAAKPIIGKYQSFDEKHATRHSVVEYVSCTRIQTLQHRETPEQPVEMYMRFDKGDPIVTHCLHLRLCTMHDHTKDMRDYLRAHPEDAMQYSQLKWRIVEQDNISMMQDEKTPFLAELKKRSEMWASGR